MPGEITVFITHQVARCGECGEELGRSAWITLGRDRGALCLACADLDGLVFLPAGDTALTRRARKHSTLSAVVLQWSRALHHKPGQCDGPAGTCNLALPASQNV